jgi:hypothetical protein
MLRKANDNIVRQALEHQLVGKRKKHNKGTRGNEPELDGDKDDDEE